MVSKMALVAVVALTFALSGCKSKTETAVDNMVSTLEDIGDRLAQIKTKQDVAGAANDLKALGARMKDQTKVLVAMEDTSAEANEKIRAKYEPRIDKAMKKTMGELERIGTTLGADTMMQVAGMIDLSDSGL